MLPVCIELEIYLMTLLWLKCIQRCIELEIYLITLLWHIPTCFMHKKMMAMPGTSITFSLSWCIQIGTWTLVLCTVHGGPCPIAATINSSSFFLTLPSLRGAIWNLLLFTVPADRKWIFFLVLRFCTITNRNTYPDLTSCSLGSCLLDPFWITPIFCG